MRNFASPWQAVVLLRFMTVPGGMPPPSSSIRGYYHALRHRRMGEFGSEWASPFARLSRRQRGHFLRKRAVGPVLTLHLAAVTLQTVVRGFQLRMAVAKTAPASAQARVPIPCRRAAIAAAARRAAGRGQKLVAAARPLARSTELSLVSRYLEAKMRHGGPPTFNDWILLRVQAWARMVPFRSFLKALRSRVLQTAARSLQQKWREYLASGKVKDNSGGLHKVVRCVLRVQRCWRSFTNRRIFAYLKETLLFREQGDLASSYDASTRARRVSSTSPHASTSASGLAVPSSRPPFTTRSTRMPP